MASLAVGLILEKIASKDKDFRYMATSDLLNELQKDSFKADADTERKVTQIVLQQLDDASGDISGLAVKCLAPLVKKVNGGPMSLHHLLCARVCLQAREDNNNAIFIRYCKHWPLKRVCCSEISEISSGTCGTCAQQTLVWSWFDFFI
ncbi:hypothetical protein R1flu_019588 [Riccia fluitans]|uniref:Uncharacterized protein n=1 Tax=Riccia fluitans TaxID=41844 RepID=A0ABD1ZJF6_9MARC